MRSQLINLNSIVRGLPHGFDFDPYFFFFMSTIFLKVAPTTGPPFLQITQHYSAPLKTRGNQYPMIQFVIDGEQ